MKDKLRLLVSEMVLRESNRSPQVGEIYITGEGDDIRLAYLDQDGNQVVISNLSENSQKPIHCSELENKLRSRAWNKLDGGRFINLGDSGNISRQSLMYRYYNGSDMPSSEVDRITDDDYTDVNTKVLVKNREIDPEQMQNMLDPELPVPGSPDEKVPNPNYIDVPLRASDLEKVYKTYEEIDDTKPIKSFYMQGRVLAESQGYRLLDRLYKETFGDMNATEEVYFYNSSKNTVDILTGAVTIDFITTNSDIYTDTLSLNDLVSYSSAPGVSGKVDLTVQYSKSGEIFSKDYTFLAFSYKTKKDRGAQGKAENKSELEMEDLVVLINSDIELEFVKGVIRVTPIIDGIDECIISNCTVTYGNLE